MSSSGSTKKQDERNEKIIRGLMKLPPNRRCINCDSLGPQYVCTNFWTFICTTCSGIHREFTHRVKSVSMAKFSTLEVEALQKGGNQRAREMFLKEWDVQQMRLPNSSNVDNIREFIKTVYVDKKYAGGRSSDKPPRDTQNNKNNEDHRRASSYHSFSQSPPYEHQYEDRRYGKQTGMLSRKPGSDRGHYEGKISSFLNSPGSQTEQIYEDKFANEISGSRIADYSFSSTGDPFKSDGQSPTFQDPGYNSPPSQQVRDILIEDAGLRTLSTHSEANVNRDLHGIPCPQRTTSSSSFGSLDGNSISHNSGSLIDVIGPGHASIAQQTKTSASPSSHLPAPAHSTNLDLFNLPTVQQPIISLTPSIDLFADMNHQGSSMTSSEQKPSTDFFADMNLQDSMASFAQKPLAVPFPENAGWAKFDSAHHVEPFCETGQGFPSVVLTGEEAPKGSINVLSSMPNNSQWFREQNSATHGVSVNMADQWHMGSLEVKGSSCPMNSQSWNAFDDSTGNLTQDSFGKMLVNSGTQVLVNELPTSVDPYIGLRFPEGLAAQERKSTNPFDPPYDSDLKANNEFLDLNTLYVALPNPEPTALLGGLSQTWISDNPLTAYPSVAQGDLAYIAGQVSGSQLQNIPAQGPVASLGGNPFA